MVDTYSVTFGNALSVAKSDMVVSEMGQEHKTVDIIGTKYTIVFDVPDEWLPEDAVLVTWSENDIDQIDDEMYFKDIDLPELYDYLDEYY